MRKAYGLTVASENMQGSGTSGRLVTAPLDYCRERGEIGVAEAPAPELQSALQRWTGARARGIELAVGSPSPEKPLEARIARIESDVAHLRSDVAEVKVDVRALRDRMDTRIDRLESKLDAFESKVDGRFASFESKVDGRFASFESKVDARFASFEAKFDARFATVDTKFAAVDTRFASLESRFDAKLADFASRLDAKFDRTIVWMISLYVGLATAMLGAMASGFGWL